MSNIDPQLLNLSEVVPIMDDLFIFNEESYLLIYKNMEILNKRDSKGNKIFGESKEMKEATMNMLRYCRLINELKDDDYKRIKSGIVDDKTMNKLKILNNKFLELIKKYTLTLSDFRRILFSSKEFTKEEIDIINNNFGKRLYEVMDVENNIIKILNIALENNISTHKKDENVNESKRENSVINNKQIQEEIKLGPLSYKNGLIYSNESLIEELDPQRIKLCYLFFIRKDEFLSYETIQSELSDSKYISKGNMQKVVSKVRTILKKETKKNLIMNVNNKGYIFKAKDML